MQRRYVFTFAVAAILLALVVLRGRRRLQKRAAQIEAERQIAAVPKADETHIEFGIERTNPRQSSEDVRADADALDDTHEAVIMRGDGGRWVYATISIRYVNCDNATLLALLFALDVRACDRPEGATLEIETVPIGGNVKAEFGDAPVVAGLWLHPNFAKRGLMPHVADVVANRRTLDSAFGAFPRPSASASDEASG